MGEEDVMLYNGTNITKECMTIDLYLSDFVWTPAYKIQKTTISHLFLYIDLLDFSFGKVSKD